MTVWSGGSEPVGFVVGDSITNLSGDELAPLRDKWRINAEPGRNTNDMYTLVETFIRNHGSKNAIIIALGTNEGGVTKARYERILDLVLPKTTVGFVTCYRDPELWGTTRAEKMSEISGWMRQIANSRPNTCTIPWRGVCLSETGLLYDGVHPNEAGQARWANLVSDTWQACRDEWLKTL